jgi:hypothetical protein
MKLNTVKTTNISFTPKSNSINFNYKPTNKLVATLSVCYRPSNNASFIFMFMLITFSQKA